MQTITKNSSVFRVHPSLKTKIHLKPTKKLWVWLVVGSEEKIFIDYMNSLNIVDITIQYDEGNPDSLKLVDNNDTCMYILTHQCVIPNKYGFLPTNSVFIHTEYINMEPINPQANCVQIQDAQRLGYKIIDFSPINAKHYNHLYLPYQIREPELSVLKHYLKQEKEYDAVMCGGLTARRKSILIDGYKKDLELVDIQGYFDERDSGMAQGKVILNIHQKDNFPHFEHFRCDRWVYAGHVIVSEDSVKQEELDVHKYIHFVPYDQLISKCMELSSQKHEYVAPPIPEDRRMTDIEIHSLNFFCSLFIEMLLELSPFIEIHSQLFQSFYFTLVNVKFFFCTNIQTAMNIFSTTEQSI